jgi:hypothetical protein
MLCAVLSFSDKAWLKSFTGNALGFWFFLLPLLDDRCAI